MDKEEVREVFESWLEELSAAMILAGGTGNVEWIKNQTFEEIYKHLLPNGIQLAFLINSDKIRNHTYCGKTIDWVE